ncbi:Na+/H+ antiporter NhaC family protein [Ferrimonas senticii]|uniref:Na+/H+ antiporter NhaC family protein n=1 Tax=Ferrimonas senticii TaxID=394566 RepID=UPI0004134DF5|nr:Na+/H+ antiporter NhaC family protein [Ferrimonas senticii]
MESFGFWAVVPPLLALILAFTTRHVVLSLGVATFTGMLIIHGGQPVDALQGLLVDGPFTQLAQGGNAQIIVVITIISGFIYLVEQSGGMKAFSQLSTRYITSPVKAKLASWLTGLGIFFTDSGNSLILGPMFAPIFDRLRVSREKLAYIIDSTSSPVCVLVPIISWGVYSQGLIENAFTNLGQKVDGFTVFLQVIPYQLYPLLALAAIPMYALLNQDWGPMAEAQRAAKEAQQRQLQSQQQQAAVDISLVLLPLAALFGTLICLFIYNYGVQGKINGPVIRMSLGSSYVVATLVAMVLYWRKRVMTPSQSFNTFLAGMQRITLILVILLLAWTLGSICKTLGTGDYISQLLDGRLPIFLVPSLVFVIGAFVSVATGSSWGTFALLIPITVPVAVTLGADPLVCIGAALSGGLLGDHASPISDTTILSSMATGCDHGSHVRTQFPYAILTGVAACIGFMVAQLTQNPWTVLLALLLQFGLIVVMTRRQRRNEQQQLVTA